MIERSDLKRMGSAEIVAAFRAGDLDHLLQPASDDALEPEAPEASDDIDQGARGKPAKSVRESLRGQTSAEVVRRHRAGELDALLRGEVK
jgi:hypothetical protein